MWRPVIVMILLPCLVSAEMYLSFTEEDDSEGYATSLMQHQVESTRGASDDRKDMRPHDQQSDAESTIPWQSLVIQEASNREIRIPEASTVSQRPDTHPQAVHPSVGHAQLRDDLCEMRLFTGGAHGAESCWCHKAINPGCNGTKCSCREGCSEWGIVRRSLESITFVNFSPVQYLGKHKDSAVPSIPYACDQAYLTIPKAFYTDLENVSIACHLGGAVNLISSLLRDSFLAFQLKRAGRVRQCVHRPEVVSVRWLHFHTFCEEVEVDGMPNKENALCATMNKTDDATTIAEAWLAKYVGL